MSAGRGLTVERMMQLGRVSRASFYRFDESTHTSHDADMDLRDEIQRIALAWPSYGRPRITAELRRRGWKVNPKRVYRILREDNLLCIRKRKFVVTTDSNHGRKIYSNMARTMLLTGVDQLWVADITYIRLREEFVFLAVILDAFSRRVIGWALDGTLGLQRARRAGTVLGRPRLYVKVDKLKQLQRGGLWLRQIAAKTGVSLSTACGHCSGVAWLRGALAYEARTKL